MADNSPHESALAPEIEISNAPSQAPMSPPSIQTTLPPTPPLSASDPTDAHSTHSSDAKSTDKHPQLEDEAPSFKSYKDALAEAPPVAEDHPTTPQSLPSVSSQKPQTPLPAPFKPSKHQLPAHLRDEAHSFSIPPPNKWLHVYSDFVTKNASSVSQIESALRSLTYIIPGRFRDAEIASESLHSSIQLLSLYHDSLLARAVSRLPGMPKIQSPHSRYTKYWTSKSPFYRKVALLLQTAQYTELLWEMAAKRRGEKVRWRVVVLIEALKAICRLLLLRITGGRMVVPPLPEREPVPEAELEGDDEAPEEDLPDDFGFLPQKKEKSWSMPRTGLTLPSLPSPSEISSFLMAKVLTADDIKPASSLLPKLQSSPAQIAEVLHICRPVIYAVAMARTKNKKSWKPWMIGLAVELAARQIRSERGRFGERESAMAKEEWNRRGWAMGWWTLRGAFYENVTKGWVDGLVNAKYMPGLVGGILEDYAFLWEEYHFSSDDM